MSNRVLPLAAAGALLLCGAAALGEPMIGGVAQKDYNGAKGARADAAAGEIHYRDEVFAGETVTTPAGGSTALRLRDATTIRIGGASTVVLDRFVYDPDAGTGEAAISFSKGIFRFVTGGIKNKEAVQLRTPTTALTIRGTNLRIHVTGDGATTVAVDEGAVDIAPCGGGEVRRATIGFVVRVSAACNGAETVAGGSFPSDPAVDGDDGPRREGGGSNSDRPGQPERSPPDRGNNG